MKMNLGVVGLAVVGIVASSACSVRDSRTPAGPSAAPAAFDGAVSAHGVNAVVHSVTGSGRASEDGVAFRTSVAAHSTSAGRASGEVVVLLDLRAYGLGKTTFVGVADCLAVDGNSAWVGAVITHSTNGDIVPAGLRTVTLVRDLGHNGQDVMHGEPFDPSVSCSDRPVVPETVVTRGNYTVR